MKKLKLLAISVALTTLISTIPVYANTQLPAEVTATSTDDQYPLSHLADWFVVDKTGTLTTKWDRDYLWLDQGMEDGIIRDYVMDCAVRDQNPHYVTGGLNVDTLIVAKLIGIEPVGHESWANSEEFMLIEKEVRDFLNSFDWRNASDMEKAIQVAKRITKADYSSGYKGFSGAYSCLVEGKADCSDYTNAAGLLSLCVDLPMMSSGRIEINHTYPVFLVDGVWLAYEPTAKSNSFSIADYNENIDRFQDGTTFLGWFADYCVRSGYVTPTDIWDKFPGMVSSTIYDTSVKQGEEQYVIFK